MAEPSPTIAYIFTTFPKSTETFLQREVSALLSRGARLRLYSLWGGGGSFRGCRVEPFPKWRLIALLWRIPIESARRPEVLGDLLRGLASRRPPSWLNFWENMLGAGFACIEAGPFRLDPPDLVHAAWGGGPATAAWLLWRFNGHRYSAAAHAYDLYEHGGDWWLDEKLRPACFVHTSTEMARRTLIDRGHDATRVHVVRRGLDRLPRLKRLRASRDPLRLVTIARLVEKKGLDRLLGIHSALVREGVRFEARLVGDGPMREALERDAARRGLLANVTFTGHLDSPQVWEQLDWADVLLHTGVVAPSGDPAGQPNVLPEAMAAGVLVVTSPTAGTTEAVTDGESGIVLPVDDPAAWVAALRRLSGDDVFAQRLRASARRWTEQHYDAHRNVAVLHRLFVDACSLGNGEPALAVSRTEGNSHP